MRKFIVKMSICAALVMTFAFSAYADECVIEICDGPVEMTEDISEDEIKKMQDGSMLPDYMKLNVIDITALEPNDDITITDSNNSENSSIEVSFKNDGVSKEAIEPYKPIENKDKFGFDNSKVSNVITGNINPSKGTNDKAEISDVGPGIGIGTDKVNNKTKAKVTTKTTTTILNSKVTPKRQDILGYARKFLGNRYVYGGNSLTEGTDCSGYVQQIFKKFGITTGRSSRDQYARIDKISKSMIRPGDLVFYSSGKEPSSINHVAIYCGDGIIIHACNSKLGIITSKMNFREPYAYGRFIKD